ncbi:MAG: NUDIX hydrolase [Rhodobacteraceae bacterium]|nr:NUDIX hydrolase [Paracoccaceae bacterium]
MNQDFIGAKAVLLTGGKLITLLRDVRPDIPYPDHWDLPGGGREPGETPLETLAREVHEELGLALGEVIWQRRFEGPHGPGWFFVVDMPQGSAERIVFGDEGQCWRLMSPAGFVGHAQAVPFLAQRVRVWLAEV